MLNALGGNLTTSRQNSGTIFYHPETENFKPRRYSAFTASPLLKQGLFTGLCTGIYPAF
jgi:hypothetical protein